jgi:hypothetical protein
MAESQPSPPTELVYLPEPSWVPAIAAVGLAMVIVGLFVGWVVSVIGALIFLPALRSWIGRTRESFSRLPRRQRPVTAVLPAAPPRRPRGA